MMIVGLAATLVLPAKAVSTNGTAMVILPLKTDSGLVSGRALTVVPGKGPTTDGTNWYWGATLVYYSTNVVPGWGTNVIVMNLTPNTYTLSLSGAVGDPGSATLTVTTNNVGQTNWAAVLTTNLLTVSFAGQTNITYSYWITNTGDMLTTNWSGGPISIDAANAVTNTFGGALTILGGRVQEGSGTKATGIASHAEGRDTQATNVYAHAEGYGNKAYGAQSHAEGSFTEATNTNAHAEGYNTKAYGRSSHAEGDGTLASNVSSHAEGLNTTASGYASRAAGAYANATNDYTYVWSDGTTFGSTATAQFSAFAGNGFRFLGGSIQGNGGGITNMNARYITATNAPGAGNALRYNGTNFYWAN